MAGKKQAKSFTLPPVKGSRVRGLLNAAKGHASQYAKSVTLVKSVATRELVIWEPKQTA